MTTPHPTPALPCYRCSNPRDAAIHTIVGEVVMSDAHEYVTAPATEAGEANSDVEFLRNVARHFWQMDAECKASGSVLAQGVSALQAARFERIADRIEASRFPAKDPVLSETAAPPTTEFLCGGSGTITPEARAELDQFREHLERKGRGESCPADCRFAPAAASAPATGEAPRCGNLWTLLPENGGQTLVCYLPLGHRGDHKASNSYSWTNLPAALPSAARQPEEPTTFEEIGPRDCVECGACGFEFAALHVDDTPGGVRYSCPVCAEAQLGAELARTRAALKEIREAAQCFTEQDVELLRAEWHDADCGALYALYDHECDCHVRPALTALRSLAIHIVSLRALTTEASDG